MLGWMETASGRGPEPSPGEVFSPVGVLAPSQIKAQVSHSAQSSQRLREVSSRQGGTVALEPWLLVLAVPLAGDGLTRMYGLLLAKCLEQQGETPPTIWG